MLSNRIFINRIILIAFLAFILLFTISCSKETKQTDKTIIAVSIVPEQTFVKAVCGDLMDVITLIPPGYSPENHESTPKEIEQINKASLYFSIGVPTEESNILPNIGNVKIIPLQDEVASVYPDRTFESGERDPHIWLSPRRVKIIIKIIAQKLSEIDPSNASIYNKNAQEYIGQLDKVDEQIKNVIEEVKNDKFIVFHPAFGYLADDYGLTMYALQEEGKEATPQHLQEMINLAKKENIKAVFYQEEVDSSQSEAFAEEIGGKTVQLEPLAADYIDNLKKMADTLAEAIR